MWRKAQADYAAGHTAPGICRIYELSLSTFKTRARREGWRRRDLAQEEAWEGVRLEDECDLDPPQALPAALLRGMAWRHASEAIRCGRAIEAQRWIKIRRELRQEEQSEAIADLARSQEQAELEAGLREADIEENRDGADKLLPIADGEGNPPEGWWRGPTRPSTSPG